MKSCIFILFLLIASSCGGGSENRQAETRVEAEPNLQPIRVSQVTNSGSVDQFSLHLFEQKFNQAVPSDILGNHPDYFPGIQLDITQVPDSYDLSYQGDEIFIHKKILLRDPQKVGVPSRKRELFFVWSDLFHGKKIQFVNYTKTGQLPNGQVLGTLASRPAWHDSERHRWFIPISQLFINPIENPVKYDPFDVDPSHMQKLTLEIGLEDGSLRIIRIHFQAIGPLPFIVPIEVDLNPSASPAEVMTSISSDGLVLRKERWTNPTSRALTLRLKTRFESPLAVYSQLRTPFYRQQAEGPSIEEWHHYDSLGKVELDHWVVRREDGSSEKVKRDSGHWTEISLGASETVEIEWKAGAKSDAVFCEFPVARRFENRWLEYPPQSFQYEMVNPAFFSLYLQYMIQGDPHSSFEDRCEKLVHQGVMRKVPKPRGEPTFRLESHLLAWTLGALKIQGEWTAKAELAHTPAAHTENPEQGDLEETLPLLETKTETDMRLGAWNQPSEAYTCQGLFR